MNDIFDKTKFVTTAADRVKPIVPRSRLDDVLEQVYNPPAIQAMRQYDDELKKYSEEALTKPTLKGMAYGRLASIDESSKEQIDLTKAQTDQLNEVINNLKSQVSDAKTGSIIANSIAILSLLLAFISYFR